MKVKKSLVPLDDDGRAILDAMQDGASVMVHVRAARQILHHRLFFALVKKVIDAGAWSATKRKLVSYLKLRVGHFDNIVDPHTGEVGTVLKSISFENMAQDEFSEFFDLALMVVCDRLLGDKQLFQGLKQEIYEAVDPNYRRAAAGQRMTLAEAAERAGVAYSAAKWRHERGRAITDKRRPSVSERAR